jgi:CrcB protein
MVTVLGVALGGAAGGVLRYALSGFVSRRIGETFPWGTLAVNVTGCFAIGALAPFLAEGSLARAIALTGVLGGYTTVSSFSFQTLALMREAQWRAAALNCALSVLLALGAALAGIATSTAFSRP